MTLNNEHKQQYDLSKLATMLNEDHIAWSFRNMDKIMPKNDIHAPEHKFLFQKNEQPLTEINYEFNGYSSKVADYLQKASATGFLVIHDDTIVTEQYYNGYNQHSTAMSMSVAKSIVSALVGIALDEGALKDVHDPITSYLPELIGSGFDGASIKDILQMSSGVRFNEDYNDKDAEIHTFLSDVFGEKAVPISKYVQQLTKLQEPGHFEYKSVDTQVLWMLLEKTTGNHVSAYLEEKLWKPLGMEQDAYWSTDLHGNEIAFTFINATLRDYAKFGRLYLHNGNWNGRQLISEQWIKASVTPDRADLMPGAANDFFGYGYQWWAPLGSDGTEFMARGIYGQHIYVNQKEHTVIVKSGVDPTVFNIHDYEAVTAYRTIIEHLNKVDKTA
ncbi:beta-lactamase family protein [Paenibacillus sp. SC116]|uniref:serine hydrolase domain-containing protein n=1 Tax=Paenibacillus sp. SC116 TaxID=2968986 RepID=UPI00215AE259|nr:serine hydrolase [Paenibacillus sp. SC116]MCR8842416.1 beta-lactamase family protein [Paenibacillus sp. SC116]